METAVSNFIEPGTKLALFAGGFFAERIGEMAKRHGAEIVRLEKPWGEAVSDDEASDFIRRERPQVVAFVQAETSTGVFQQSKALCDAAHEVDAIVIADCVTSLGAMPVDIDANGIDVAYSCTQKGLSAPPGLSPMTISPRAQERLKQRKQPNRSWYFDLSLISRLPDASRTAIITRLRQRFSTRCVSRWRSSRKKDWHCASNATTRRTSASSPASSGSA